MTLYEKIVAMWQGYNIKTACELDGKLDSFRVLFAYNSGKIENDEVTYEDTREVFSDNRVRSFAGSPTTLTEISNQRKCYEFLLPKIIKCEPITLELIKEVHAITVMATYDNRRFFELGERPGSFKKGDFVVGEGEHGSAPEDVQGDLQNLLEEINDAERLIEPTKILKTAAYFHAWYETIHPFADGNGRTGRTLMNYFLMVNNHPPLIVYDEDRKAYYTALDRFRDVDADLQPLFGFLQQQLIKTWEATLKRNRL